MKAEKIITTTMPIDLEVTDITLLSAKEYESYRNDIPNLRYAWWLLPTNDRANPAAFIDEDGEPYKSGSLLFEGRRRVRPVLKISNLKTYDICVSDKIIVAGMTWTVISDDSALLDTAIGYMCFRKDWKAPDAGDFKKSDVKKWLQDWAKANNIL